MGLIHEPKEEFQARGEAEERASELRREILEAFASKYGCEPEEAQVVQRTWVDQSSQKVWWSVEVVQKDLGREWARAKTRERRQPRLRDRGLAH